MIQIDIGRTINTLANVGALVGIIFLAIEVSHNQASLREANRINLVQARNVTMEAYWNSRQVIVQDQDLSRIELSGNRGDELNELDAKRYQDLWGGTIWITAETYERWMPLAMESRAQAAVETLSNSISQNPGVRRCWKALSNALEIWGFGSFVDGVEARGQ